MQRILTATIFLLTLGLAFAQPPVDYTLLCEVEVEVEGEVETALVVFGVASYVDDKLHVALDEGVTCKEGTETVEDETLTVDVVFDTEGEATVTLATDVEGAEDMSAVAQTLPEEAIAGMVGAQKNRAMAADHREAAQQKADEARARGEGAPDDVEGAPEEHLPEELPVTPDDEGDEAEAAIEHANEMSGGMGPDAKPEAPGEGRP